MAVYIVDSPTCEHCNTILSVDDDDVKRGLVELKIVIHTKDQLRERNKNTSMILMFLKASSILEPG